MKITGSIYPDKRSSSDFYSLHARLHWIDDDGYRDTRRSLGIKIHKSEWSNRATPCMCTVNGVTKTIYTNIIGTSDEATIARDQVYKINSFIKTLDLETPEQNLSAFARYVESLKGGNNLALSMQTLTQFIEKFIQIKNSTYSYNRIRKYKTLQRNLLLFCAWKKYSDNMFELNSDQQAVFFSEYIDFLVSVTVTKTYKDDKMILKFNQDQVIPTGALLNFIQKQERDLAADVKKLYQNGSVKEDFTLITAVSNQFETGISVIPNDFCKSLKTGDTQGTYCELDELVAIWNTPRRTLTEEKTISIFIFVCFSGLRNETLYEVENQNITNKLTSKGSIKVLNYTADKEGNTATVPLSKICIDILDYWKNREFKVPEKRDTSTKNTKYYPNCLLPVIAFTEMNETLHEFLKRVPGMDRICREVRWSGKHKIDTRITRWEQITMYAARHTYSHLLTSGGLTLDEASPLMSHTSADTIKKNYNHIDENKATEKAYGIMELFSSRLTG